MRRVLEPGSVKEEDLVRWLMEASNRGEMPITCLLKGFPAYVGNKVQALSS